MPHALAAAYYADRAVAETVEIAARERLARDTHRLRFRSPAIAERIAPGQFVMLRLAGFDDPLLGRALALFDVPRDGRGTPTGEVDVVYLVVGRMTGRLAAFHAGQKLEAWGPLGNGFSTVRVPRLVMVAGGIGMTPFLAVAAQALGVRGFGGAAAERLCERVTFCYGARSADYFAAVEQFEQLGVDVRLSTDDGSRGHHGRVTDVLAQVLAESGDAKRVLCCGPEPMMEAVAEVCRRAAVPCEVSLETPMACGIGICFSCVTKVRQSDGGWDYKRTCVEGPVFDAECIEWR